MFKAVFHILYMLNLAYPFTRSGVMPECFMSRQTECCSGTAYFLEGQFFTIKIVGKDCPLKLKRGYLLFLICCVILTIL